MNVLVTGATGFLGQKLAIRLVSLGYNVTGIGRNSKIGEFLQSNGVQYKMAALEDRNKIISLCQNQQFVFHCGALSSPWGKYKEFYLANVEGTKNVIEGCRKARVERLIHVSTPSISFYFDERRNVTETDLLPKRFVNHYAKTKYLAELEVDKAFKDGLAAITIRPRAIFGPGDNAILPRLIKVCEKGMFPKIGSGDVEIDLTYVENVVDAMLLCMTSTKETLGQKYNITNGERVNLYSIIEEVMNQLGKNFTYKEISYKKAMIIAQFLEYSSKVFLGGKEPILTRYTVSVLSQSQTLQIKKAEEELSYKPAVSIKEGTKDFIEWWKQNAN
ncbi:NAD-dependent epimerase/dehydratase family protein [Metabacillus litoralis]|uniref:NAD-dependent epimerase/dehydratase family protein n=1 Tax=Metabacillus litoralis TaxID=152268 RepID=UPI001CFD88C9|nr:NAD-dependent epimerase/dehydratase family protein [Metabacillus litoralis]